MKKMTKKKTSIAELRAEKNRIEEKIRSAEKAEKEKIGAAVLSVVGVNDMSELTRMGKLIFRKNDGSEVSVLSSSTSADQEKSLSPGSIF